MKNKYVIVGDVVYIELRRREGPSAWTMIDLADFEKVSSWPNRWWLTTARSLAGPVKHYVGSELTWGTRKRKERKTILLHRFITDAPDDYDVDHWNKNPLDNRRKTNLRVVTRAVNVKNTGRNKRNTSGYKNVTFHAKTGKWRARTAIDGERVSLGLYDTPKEASLAVERAEDKQGFGEEYRRGINCPSVEAAPSIVHQYQPEWIAGHSPEPVSLTSH